MDFRWVAQVSEKELNAAMVAIRAEIESRDRAKAQRLRNAIDNAIRDFLDAFPSAYWIIEIEDDDWFHS